MFWQLRGNYHSQIQQEGSTLTIARRIEIQSSEDYKTKLIFIFPISNVVPDVGTSFEGES
jgi:hypothetical protein